MKVLLNRTDRLSQRTGTVPCCADASVLRATRPRISPGRSVGPNHRSFGRAGKRAIAAVLRLALACAVLPGPSAIAGQPLPLVTLRLGTHQIRAELADTPKALRQGLMHRTRLATNSGMLFVLGQPDLYCFWMKDTPLPLSIAFIDATGHIIAIQDMEPHSLEPHCPPAPITTALEMQQGWFRQAGVRVGDWMHRAHPVQ